MQKTIIAVLLMAFSNVSVHAEGVKSVLITDPVYTAPVRLVDIGHVQRLNLFCTGSGSPAVIFDAGMADSSISWALVQPIVSKATMACSYDRAGLGFSDAARRPGTPINESEDLHALLQAAHIASPYILVGHSMAGMNARVFASKYQGDVAGMVLVDPSHEDQSLRAWATGKAGQKEEWDAYLKAQHACIDDAEKGFDKASDAFKKCVGGSYDRRFSDAINSAQERFVSTPKWQAAAASERENFFYESASQTRKTIKNFASIPIIVLTRTSFPSMKDETQSEHDRGVIVWQEFHTQIASMSTRGINIIVPNSSHYIQYDHPQIVADAILEAVNVAREK